MCHYTSKILHAITRGQKRLTPHDTRYVKNSWLVTFDWDYQRSGLFFSKAKSHIIPGVRDMIEYISPAGTVEEARKRTSQRSFCTSSFHIIAQIQVSALYTSLTYEVLGSGQSATASRHRKDQNPTTAHQNSDRYNNLYPPATPPSPYFSAWIIDSTSSNTWHQVRTRRGIMYYNTTQTAVLDYYHTGTWYY